MSMQLQLTREASLIIAFTCLQVYVLVKKMIIYHGAVRLQNTPGQWALYQCSGTVGGWEIKNSPNE